ncbi:PREDICTED: putative F-box/FBD/LRR-repeat protein At4g13965 [Camelina sativa]|uniref:F-box/FBD/LRR-repeat protein At4g13965 n=1 Tax=Camelina sativa TaxID=90675 RepID=A0ABM0ZDU4_CAMSA|nr:PREDICTED: putative F-box/FBD/LRR-repeat protein At4g13965 [Camelina sativa]
MEQRKIDGFDYEEDRISQLPEALILEILSHLPMEVAVTTSVLSKQWQSLWKTLPKLSFDSCGPYQSKALLLQKAPVLKSLHLNICFDEFTAMDTEKLIGIAFARNLRKLVLQVNYIEKFRFPTSFYNVETLETLELKYSILLDVPASSVCLKSLRTLHLFYVIFKDDASVMNLLSGCPNLENLNVHGNGNVKTFTIAVPSLQRLTIYNNDGSGQSCGGYVINAPSLKYLKIEVYTSLDFCLIEKVTDLRKANLIVDPQIINENLLESITSVQRLSLRLLSPLEFKFPRGSIFYNLVYLELYTTYEPSWWNLLTPMLDGSPNLQVLKLNGKLGWRKDLVACGNSWNRPEKVPECLLWNLETFVWDFYAWNREGEVEVAKYILSNSNRLKRATFSSKHITDPKERDNMVEDLNSVVRASSSCQLLVI